MFLERLLLLGAVALATPSLGCQDYPDKVAPTADAKTDTTDINPDVPLPEGPLPSLSSRLKARTGTVYANDLAVALELPRESVCKELGRYDCAETVHKIALGGVEPYVLGLQNPLPIAPITAPIAIDRIALNACVERARLDFEEMGQGVFAPLAVVDGPPSVAVREEVVGGLYRKLLKREANAEELSLAVAFYDELADGTAPTRDFAVLSCFAVATHVEAVFY